MSTALPLLVALLVVFGPGLALLLACGLRRPVLLVALAAPASVTVCGVVAVAVAPVGLPYGPVAVGIAVLLLVALAVLDLWRHPVRLRRPAAGVVVGALTTAGAAGVAVATWLIGMGALTVPDQEHDMVIHQMITAYIMRTGRAAPWEIVPADVLTGQPTSFYPSGFHLLSGLVSDLTGDAVVGINATMVIVLGIVLCLSVAALTAVGAAQLRLSPGAGALAGGLAALVVAGLYRPMFQLMHDGGILGNAAAFAVVPGVIAGVLLLSDLRERRWRAVAVGAAAAGAVWVHPSAAVSVGVTVVAWWLGQAVSAEGRRQLRRLVVPVVLAGGAVILVAAPSVLPGLGVAGRTAAFPADTTPTTLTIAVGRTLTFPYSGFFDPDIVLAQTWPAALTVLGAAVVIALRRGLGPVAAWGAWTVIVIAQWMTPGKGFEAPITAVFYNAMLRTWSHVSLTAPVLVGLGVVVAAHRVAAVVARRTPLSPRPVAVGLAVLAWGVYAAVPAPGYFAKGVETVATRFSRPDFVRVGADDRRAIDWLAAHVRPGERVFNSPNDGSTFLYVLRGVPVVNVYTLGLPGVPYSYRLLADFDDYPRDPAVRRELQALDVRWVYVDSSAPRIGSKGSPEGWAGQAGFTVAPGLAHLDGLPGTTLAFRSGTVSVYAVDPSVAAPAAP